VLSRTHHPHHQQNHAYIPVTVTGVTDANVGDTVTISITGVTQDESVTAKSDTATTWTCPDAIISGATVKLSAEALSTSPNNGRVYAISYTATDKAGASCTGTVKVCARTGTTACVQETTKFTSTKCA
jgi:hypothetical protein